MDETWVALSTVVGSGGAFLAKIGALDTLVTGVEEVVTSRAVASGVRSWDKVGAASGAGSNKVRDCTGGATQLAKLHDGHIFVQMPAY